MSSDIDRLKSAAIEKAKDLVDKTLPAEKAALAKKFTELYCQNIPVNDLLETETEVILGSALALWSYGRDREPGTHKIRVYNPDIEQYGWHSDHTVIEIINDDMPFIIDSVLAHLNRRENIVHIVVHPIVAAKRNEDGRVTDVTHFHEATKSWKQESFVHIEIDAQSSQEIRESIQKDIDQVLKDVRAATSDWKLVLEKSNQALQGLSKLPKSFPKHVHQEAISFLEWMKDNHFTFLGYREYVIDKKGNKTALNIIEDSGLGILRDPNIQLFEGQRQLKNLPPDVQEFMEKDELVLMTKTNKRSTVHRAVQMDAVVVKQYDKNGKLSGECLFVGLFTSSAYIARVQTIPIIRQKVQNTFDKACFTATGHDGKALMHILETFPRDELFQISEEDLARISLGILHLQERQRTALFIRKDPFERFISAIVYIPREKYNNTVRHNIQGVLENAFQGKVTAFYPQLADDSVLARAHYIIKTNPGNLPEFDVHVIEKKVIEAGRDWSDQLKESLIDMEGEERGFGLWRDYHDAFPVGYRENFKTTLATLDILRLESICNGAPLAMNLYHPLDARRNEFRFKIYHKGDQIPLSSILPMLENMGATVLDENPFRVFPLNRDSVWIHDFGLKFDFDIQLEIGDIRERFQEAFEQIWLQNCESDNFNKLVLVAGINWREVVILRAYSKYLRQAGIQFSQEYMQETLIAYPEITKNIVKLFHTRFGTENRDDVDQRIKELEAAIKSGLDQVFSLDQDLILRRFHNLIEATLRTNFFQKENESPKAYLSFKFESGAIEELPLPRPMYEIFVYSPRMEGIHLRGGQVARGGLRWSDRREDFRTEVLGLMKAQMVKNSVIVPVGSKGGFVVKYLPKGSREEVMNEVVFCYQTFIRGLLDITDNLKANEVIPPEDVVRYDDDDPYLVVAADKGTATFSDIANKISCDYGFWLGDAFASGGSSGYDHKKMGITARGAWESVKRHFRELGKDTQTEEFTVTGVGDMSGDVFGNGMLLSKEIKLVAAFNHMHIFLDPNPNAAKSYAERERLFEKPRSTWEDYDKKLISKGGGIFSRDLKSIPLSPEVKKLLKLSEDQITPNELMKAILKAETDLLWFGGIGTYIKSSEENNLEVGDRANDAIRIDSTDLNCKVIGEGANLGVTQRARIEFALQDGKINTDAIDNSAGVDCSDHEVNIKILLDEVVTKGDLTPKQRDQLLSEMTDQVSDLVLRNNYLQTQTLTVIDKIGLNNLDRQIRLMEYLEKKNRLNREIEFLPNNKLLQKRKELGHGLTRPELSVLLAYAKNVVYDLLLATDFADNAAFQNDLLQYFPDTLREKFTDEVLNHRLKKEIIVTTVANLVINRAGPSFIHEMKYRTGLKTVDICKAFIVTRNVFGLETIWNEIESLDNKVSAEIQTDMIIETQRLVERGTSWFLNHGIHPIDIQHHCDIYKQGVSDLSKNLVDLLPPETKKVALGRAKKLTDAKVPKTLAMKIATLEQLSTACDIVNIAIQMKSSIQEAGKIYFAVGEKFGLRWLRTAAHNLKVATDWDRRAIMAIIEDLFGQQSALTTKIIDSSGKKLSDINKTLDNWVKNEPIIVDKSNSLIGELRQNDSVDLSMLIVANRHLRSLLQ